MLRLAPTLVVWVCVACVAGSFPPLTAPVLAADWPRFRGPNGSGINPDSFLPSELDPDKNLLWRVALPGGNSSPIVRDQRVFITAEEGGERAVICLDASSGKRIWEKSFAPLRRQPAHERVGRASPTPTADDTGVYAFFTDLGLVALDADGEERWRVPLGPFRSIYGISTSPILTDRAVILVMDQTQGSFIAAFSKRDGEMLWRTDRPDGSGGYATPVLIGNEERRVLVSGSREIATYGANTGRRAWHLDGLPASSFYSPIADGGQVYVGMASPSRQSRGFAAYDRNADGRLSGDELDEPSLPGVFQAWAVSVGDGDGVLTPDELATASAALRSGRATLFAVRTEGGLGDDDPGQAIRWKRFKDLPLAPSPLLYGGVLYLLKNGGILTAVDPDTGDVIKQGRLRSAIDGYTASPVAAAGRMLFASESGKLTVVRAGADWQELSTHDVSETIYASPAIADDRVYVRTRQALWCFGLRTAP